MLTDHARASQVSWVEHRLGRPATADDLDASTLEAAMRGRAVTYADLRAAQEQVAATMGALPRWWDTYDVLVTPTMRRTPWPLGEDAGPLHCGLFAAPFSFTGQPAYAHPVTRDHGGLPVGVQLVGRHHADETLLSLGSSLRDA